MQELADQNRQLSRVLIHGRDTNAAAPVVVEMSLLVCEHLDLVSGPAAGIVDDVVTGRPDCPLTSRLTNQEEIVAETK